MAPYDLCLLLHSISCPLVLVLRGGKGVQGQNFILLWFYWFWQFGIRVSRNLQNWISFPDCLDNDVAEWGAACNFQGICPKPKKVNSPWPGRPNMVIFGQVTDKKQQIICRKQMFTFFRFWAGFRSDILELFRIWSQKYRKIRENENIKYLFTTNLSVIWAKMGIFGCSGLKLLAFSGFENPLFWRYFLYKYPENCA